MNLAGLRDVYIFNQQGGDAAVKPELLLIVRSLPASSMKAFAYLMWLTSLQEMENILFSICSQNHNMYVAASIEFIVFFF